jgi:hypothetical protein
MTPRQFLFSFLISIGILLLIVRLIQNGRLDISYCWLWLSFGIILPLLVVYNKVLIIISSIIGAVTPTTTLFLFAILVLFLMCLQFSIVISNHRRQIKKLTQQLALRTEEEKKN